MPKILEDKRDPVKKALGEKLRALKKEDPEQLEAMLGKMSNDEAEEILHDPEIWSRENQWIDLSHPAPTTAVITGRG